MKTLTQLTSPWDHGVTFTYQALEHNGHSTTWKHSTIKRTEYVGPKLNPGRVNDFSPYYLQAQRALIISDVHIPYHNREALMMALQYGKDFGADCVILNGDIIDCYQLSNFQKDFREESFPNELRELHNFLSDLRENFPGEIIYKMGNHEERYERWILDKGKDLTGLIDADGQEILSEVVDELERLHNQPVKLDRQWLEEKIKHYQNLIK